MTEILTALKFLVSQHRIRPQAHSLSDGIKCLHKVSSRIIASVWEEPFIIFLNRCFWYICSLPVLAQKSSVPEVTSKCIGTDLN